MKLNKVNVRRKDDLLLDMFQNVYKGLTLCLKERIDAKGRKMDICLSRPKRRADFLGEREKGLPWFALENIGVDWVLPCLCLVLVS